MSRIIPQQRLDAAAKAAFTALAEIGKLRKALSDIEIAAQQAQEELDLINTNREHFGKTQEIDDIAGTPFQVVYTPGLPCFDKIVIRGVDVTEAVTTMNLAALANSAATGGDA